MAAADTGTTWAFYPQVPSQVAGVHLAIALVLEPIGTQSPIVIQVGEVVLARELGCARRSAMRIRPKQVQAANLVSLNAESECRVWFPGQVA